MAVANWQLISLLSQQLVIAVIIEISTGSN